MVRELQPGLCSLQSIPPGEVPWLPGLHYLRIWRFTGSLWAPLGISSRGRSADPGRVASCAPKVGSCLISRQLHSVSALFLSTLRVKVHV